MRFKKGESGNPKGRPVGGFTEATKQFMKLKELAAEKSELGFEMLWGNMEKNESWAYKIFFDLLPKKLKEQTALIRAKDGETRIDALTRALSEFEELTHDEVMHEFKTLSQIQLLKEINNDEDILKVLSDEQIEKLNDMYKTAKSGKA